MTVTMITDRDLIERLAAGEQDLLGELLARHWEPAYRVALRFTRDPASAEDVAQEAFVKLLQKAKAFDGTRAFRPWFFRIVENASKTHLRAAKRRVRHEERAAKSEGVAGDELPWIHEIVGKLGKAHRDALTLHYLYGLTFEEVATRLGVPVGTVASRMRRGIEALRVELKPAHVMSAGAAASFLCGSAEASVPSAPSANALLARAAGPLAGAPKAPSADALLAVAQPARGLGLGAALGALVVALVIAATGGVLLIEPPGSSSGPVAAARAQDRGESGDPTKTSRTGASAEGLGASARAVPRDLGDTPLSAGGAGAVPSAGVGGLRRVSGRVHVGAEPMPGATVVFRVPGADGRKAQSVRVDQGGLFEIRVPKEATRFEMQVRPPGCDYAVGIGVTVGDGYHPGGAKVDSWVPIDLYSEAQAVNVDVLDRLVTGRVVDVDDRAVPDARVEVNFTRRSKVEAGGRFAVWVSTKGESGFAFVTARAVGHGVGAAAVPRATEDASEVVIRLAPERTLEIRVIDEQGGPVAGARVVGTVNLQPQNPPKGLNVELGVLLGSRTTDAEGRVRFAKIPAPTAEGLGENAEQLQLRLKKAGYATQQVSLHVGSRAAPLRVVLERPRQLKGRIVDASGAGVVGARMRLLMSPGGVEVEVAPKASSEEFAAGGPQVAVSNVRVTDGQGGFSYDGVAAGDYHLDVFGPGVIPRIVRVSVPGEELLISVERSVPFTGLVVDEAGRPVADVAIEIYPSQSLAGMSVDDYFNDADSSGFPERLGGARTDDEGRFSAEGVASGHFDVFMNGRYEQKIVCDVSSGQLRPLTFPRTQVADVLFRPIAAESGRRLRNLKVVVYDASGARLYATSWGNQDPSYRATLKLNSGDVGDVFVEEPGIELRAAGALRLELSAPGRVPVVVPVSARLGSQVNLGEIPMPKGGGRVRFKVLADAPLAVASVTFVTAEGLRHKEFVEGGPVELTLAPGALTFELHAWTITDGDFEITPETAIKRSVTVSVVTGETRDVVFDLRGE